MWQSSRFLLQMPFISEPNLFGKIYFWICSFAMNTCTSLYTLVFIKHLPNLKTQHSSLKTFFLHSQTFPNVQLFDLKWPATLSSSDLVRKRRDALKQDLKLRWNYLPSWFLVTWYFKMKLPTILISCYSQMKLPSILVAWYSHNYPSDCFIFDSVFICIWKLGAVVRVRQRCKCW